MWAGKANASERKRVTPSAPACWLAVLFWCAEDKRRCGPLSPPAGSDSSVVPEVVVCGKCSPLFAGYLLCFSMLAGFTVVV